MLMPASRRHATLTELDSCRGLETFFCGVLHSCRFVCCSGMKLGTVTNHFHIPPWPYLPRSIEMMVLSSGIYLDRKRVGH